MKHIKIVITLTFVVLLASVMVFYVEAWTTPIIEDYNFEQANLAKFEVLPLLDSSDSIEPVLDYDFTGSTITELIVVPGKGYIYTASFNGYNGAVPVIYMIGIDLDSNITGFKTLIQSETPGLGGELASDWFTGQFLGMTTATVEAGDFDGITGATVSTGGMTQSLNKLMIFHKVTFGGVVVETPEEMLIRFKEEITFEGAVITDASADYSLSTYVTKVELANDGTNDTAVIYTVEFTGYVGTIEYIIAYDLETNDIIGLRVVENPETFGIGLVLSDDEFNIQFDEFAQADALAGEFDEVAGSSAPVTYGGFEISLSEVTLFHQAAFEGVEVETPEEMLIRYKEEITFAGAIITDASADYTLTNYVTKVELANNGTTDVAVIYTVEFAGYGDVVEYIIAFDLTTKDIIGFRVTFQVETPGWGASITEESFSVQFETLTQADALSGNIDALSGASGAPITAAGLKDSLVQVVNFHQAAFEGTVVETPEEMLIRYKEEITVVGALITDASADYTLTDFVTKVELANDGSEDVAVIYTVEFTGYNGSVPVVYLISFDLTTNDIIGFRVLSQSETTGLGSKISEESFWVQFDALTQTDALAGNIDALSGATITTDALKVSLVQVVNFHKVEFEDAVIVREDPITTTNENLLLAFPSATSFNSVYLDYIEHLTIDNIYEALDIDGTTVLGYVYFVHTAGNNGNIQFLLGVDLTKTTTNIIITQAGETWGYAEEWSTYDGSQGEFPDTPWLTAFEGVTLQSLLDTAVDTVAGVTITTSSVISAVEVIAGYHIDNSVGGTE